MIMKVLAYKDTKLNIFTAPVYMDGSKSNEDIIESARRMCADENVPLVYFRYDLYLLGSYDDKIGKIVSQEPEFLVSLADYKHLASDRFEKVDKVDVVC